MDKHIKLLVENLFDDFDPDILNDLEAEISKTLDDAIKITSLLECRSVYQINNYIYDTLNKNNKLLEWLNSIDSWYKNPYMDKRDIDRLQFSNKIYLSCTRDKSPYIMYRGNLSTFPETTYVRVSTSPAVVPTQKIVWKVCDVDVSKQAKKVIDAFNIENYRERFTNVTNTILNVIHKVYNVERLMEEISCTGKVYTVVNKDIDRMSKCISTQNFSGFDKITKPEKLVARLAALFICAKNQGYNNISINELNDDILLQAIAGSSLNKTNDVKRGKFISALKRLQEFPSLHIKDVIETYNAYKNKF